MKVICIYDTGVDCANLKYSYKYLTINKIYEIIEEIEYRYQLIDDSGHKSFYLKKLFKTSSEIRNEKIERLLR